jgi:uncharacterized SAM-binding protein YcdF (DUF218 family)
MAAILGYVFSPSGPIVVLVIAAIWLLRWPSSTIARRFVIAAAVIYAFASLHIVPFGISRLLTLGYHQFKASDVEPGTTAVVVLGGGDEFVDGWTDQITVTTNVEAARVLETRRVFRLISPAWIISSGGHSDPDDRAQASSLTMRDELVRLGVPQERILLESASRNTYDEAVLVAPMLRSLGIQQLVLVTSDTHMRRALGAFRAVGVKAVPAIAPDARLPTRWFWWIVPTDGGLELSREVTREVGGIPYYWLRGRWR